MFGLTAFAGEAEGRPADTSYEVYYFHASWRCVNCTNAENWTKETVAAVAAANDKDALVFKAIDMEKNAALTKELKAKRVDVVVVEIRNGKRTRFANLGNLLESIKGKDDAKAKPAVVKIVRDGLKAFDAKAKTPWLVMPPLPEPKAAL